MQLCGLTQLQLFEEEEHHTRAILGSGPGGVYLAFRGTVTTRNALTDVQAWQTRHPLQPLPGRRARVHAGFLKVRHAPAASTQPAIYVTLRPTTPPA